MRLNDLLSGHFGAYLPIAPAEIEQLEIIRGAGAALYGPDAVGGVINIVTKTFAATARRHEAELTSTTLRGEWNLWHTNTGGFLAANRLRLGGGILLNTTDGQPRDSPSTLRSDANLKTYPLSAAYEITPRLSLAARTNFDRRRYNAQYFYSNSPADQARETTTRDWYQAQVRYQHNERSRTEAQVSVSRSTDYFVFTPTSVPSNHLMHYTNVLLSHQRQFSDRLRATVGGQADRRAIVSNDRGTHAVWHSAAFAVVALTPAPGLALTGGLRLDHDQAYGTELVPQLNASQQIGKVLTVCGAVGRAIRAPDFTERYNNHGQPALLRTGLNVGNAALQAERTVNYELGADYQPLPGITAKLTGFRRRGNNQIDYVPTSGRQVIETSGLTNLNPAATYRFAQNLFDVTTQGLESELAYQHQFTPQTRFDGSVGYTYVRVSNAENIASQYLANTCPARGFGHGGPDFPPAERQPERPVEATRRRRRGRHQPYPTHGIPRFQRPPRSRLAARASLAHGPGPEPVQRTILRLAGCSNAQPLADGRPAAGPAPLGACLGFDRNIVSGVLIGRPCAEVLPPHSIPLFGLAARCRYFGTRTPDGHGVPLHTPTSA